MKSGRTDGRDQRGLGCGTEGRHRDIRKVLRGTAGEGPMEPGRQTMAGVAKKTAGGSRWSSTAVLSLPSGGGEVIEACR